MIEDKKVFCFFFRLVAYIDPAGLLRLVISQVAKHALKTLVLNNEGLHYKCVVPVQPFVVNK